MSAAPPAAVNAPICQASSEPDELPANTMNSTSESVPANAALAPSTPA